MREGGALAILGALAIACDASMALRKDQVVCYAVAAPRVGNRSFAAAYELLVPNTWNVINDQVCCTALTVCSAARTTVWRRVQTLAVQSPCA